MLLGECHSSKVSKGGLHEIFISPLMDDSVEVAGVLSHEIAHIAAGIEAQHGVKFIKVCKYVGLTSGNPRSVKPGKILEDDIRKFCELIGPYPHTAMVQVSSFRKRKTTPAPKVVCLHCGCNFRMSEKWVEEAGLPRCGCGKKMLIEE